MQWWESAFFNRYLKQSAIATPTNQPTDQKLGEGMNDVRFDSIQMPAKLL